MFPLLATPILLTFASLALLPVLLHFLRRFKKRRVEFAATMFLHSALAPRRRTNQLWRWILLLLRILVVLLVAFALARPQITQDAGQGDVDPDRPPRMHVLVIDATGSMRADLKTAEQPRARDQTLANQTLQTAIQLPGTHFASAIDAALQIVAQAPAGDTFQVLRVASRIEPMLPSASQKRDRVRDALESMKCGFGAADVAVALQMVNTNLVRPGSPSTLHLFTDGQRNQWAPQFIHHLQCHGDVGGTKSAFH
ncbi:MAG: BatA domain-containing protein, partial [Planctomycetota bacterium]